MLVLRACHVRKKKKKSTAKAKTNVFRHLEKKKVKQNKKNMRPKNVPTEEKKSEW